MKLTDTHSHLYEPEFDADPEEALARAAEAGVVRLPPPPHRPPPPDPPPKAPQAVAPGNAAPRRSEGCSGFRKGCTCCSEGCSGCRKGRTRCCEGRSGCGKGCPESRARGQAESRISEPINTEHAI